MSDGPDSANFTSTSWTSTISYIAKELFIKTSEISLACSLDRPFDFFEIYIGAALWYYQAQTSGRYVESSGQTTGVSVTLGRMASVSHYVVFN